MTLPVNDDEQRELLSRFVQHGINVAYGGVTLVQAQFAAMRTLMAYDALQERRQTMNVEHLPEGHGLDELDVLATHDDEFTAPGYEGVPHTHRQQRPDEATSDYNSPDNMEFPQGLTQTQPKED